MKKCPISPAPFTKKKKRKKDPRKKLEKKKKTVFLTVAFFKHWNREKKNRAPLGVSGGKEF